VKNQNISNTCSCEIRNFATCGVLTQNIQSRNSESEGPLLKTKTFSCLGIEIWCILEQVRHFFRL